MEPPSPPIRGRGAAGNPANRFEPLAIELDAAESGRGGPGPATEFLRDPSRSIVATNDSPDVGFDASVNPYRGCEHGCTYCYARPGHEYLGYSAGLDFESRILVKERAPELLRRALAAPGWRPRSVALSGVTDCYQPVERRLCITRRCLEVLAEFRNPVAVVTKSSLVTRDLDVLGELARFDACSVAVSVTTLDAALARAMEPRAPRPALRLAAIERLAAAGVPVGVMIAPVIPGLTDHELPQIAEAAARAGARFAGTILLRLPFGLAEQFERWLARHVPERRRKVMQRVRAMRGGRLNDPRFGSRMRGSGIFAEQIQLLHRMACRRAGLATRGPELSCAAFRRPAGPQLELFG
ncbi:MAG: PA0069 family radical SAM protein [Deltaproteobacteria bacterium]|nr:MAG: PA0069 family radical SAM protein [Deltaproteobacteria bacterium]